MAGKKELIMASAAKLLEKHNYKDITVLDIVSDSGVNRNTFYYHFKDMPSLVEELARRQVDRIFDKKQLSVDDKLRELVDCLYENRRTVMHVYNYADRAVFDKGLHGLSEHIVNCILDGRRESFAGSDEEWERTGLVCKSCVFGLISSLLLKCLPESEKDNIQKLCVDPLTNPSAILSLSSINKILILFPFFHL